MSPPYPLICGIYLPFQVNVYVPNSKRSNEILFCMLEQLMLQLGLPISSMLGGLFSEEWTPLLIHEKGPVTGMPSPMIQKLPQGCCMLEALVVSSKPWIDACWWLGEYKPLSFCLGTAYNACSMEDTSIS